MTLVSLDPVTFSPGGSGRTYTFRPLSHRLRLAMYAQIDATYGPSVPHERLVRGRREALQRVNPPDLPDLLAVMDEIENAPVGEPLAFHLECAQEGINDLVRADQAFRRMLLTNAMRNNALPLECAAFGLVAWAGPGLPPLRKVGLRVPDDVLDAVPREELDELGWDIWNRAHLTQEQEKNSGEVLPSRETTQPSQ
jgi:hypothetical protein